MGTASGFLPLPPDGGIPAPARQKGYVMAKCQDCDEQATSIHKLCRSCQDRLDTCDRCGGNFRGHGLSAARDHIFLSVADAEAYPSLRKKPEPAS